jgi:hypothetical protein
VVVVVGVNSLVPIQSLLPPCKSSMVAPAGAAILPGCASITTEFKVSLKKIDGPAKPSHSNQDTFPLVLLANVTLYMFTVGIYY